MSLLRSLDLAVLSFRSRAYSRNVSLGHPFPPPTLHPPRYGCFFGGCLATLAAFVTVQSVVAFVHEAGFACAF